jgi:pimeloyl-ACP methyl ester carboxylesterase
MSVVLIVLLVLVVAFLVAAVVLGRTSYEVESARDTEYLELEGSWIRYDVIGGGPPVVLVHGWLSSSRVWDRLAGRLAQRFTVYTLDLPGFGESDKPLSGYGIRNGSRLLYAFCAHFGLTRASVVGHDLGGNMAVKLAADHPDVVGRLVLVATPADEDQIDLPTPLWLATLPLIGPIFYSVGRVVRPLRALWMRPFVLEAEDLPDEAVEDASMSTPAAMSKTLSISRREISGGRLARQARILKVPMLLISGEEDQIVDPQAVGAWARSADRAEVVLLDGCGHLPMVERTAEFNAQVLAFLTGDARYLDYVETRQYDEEAEEAAVEAGEERPRDEPGPAEASVADEVPATDVPGGPVSAERSTASDPDSDPNGEARSGAPPNIIRKRGGRYPGRDEQEPSEDFGNGAERGERREEPPVSGEERPVRDEASGRGIIPEVPEDLFDWPEPRRDFRARGRAKERSTEEEDATEDLGPPEEDTPR